MESTIAKKQFVDPEDWQKFAEYLRDTNRFILSEYWENFIRLIVKTSIKRTKILKKGIKLVRARNGTSWMKFNDGDEQPCPISPHEMGPPQKHLSKEGRLNSEGIPYLYLATNIDTAVAEIRPWIGSQLNIGYFEILDDCKIVDTSSDEPKNPLSKYRFTNSNENFEIKKRAIETYTADEKEEYIWGDINSAFSTPISPDDSHLRYLPTQYLAEKLKINNYDGIAFRSSLSPNGHNIALFDPNKAKCVSCRMFEIKKIKYEYEECGNPIIISKDNKVVYQKVEFIVPENTEKKQEKSDQNKKAYRQCDGRICS